MQVFPTLEWNNHYLLKGGTRSEDLSLSGLSPSLTLSFEKGLSTLKYPFCLKEGTAESLSVTTQKLKGESGSHTPAHRLAADPSAEGTLSLREQEHPVEGARTEEARVSTESPRLLLLFLSSVCISVLHSPGLKPGRDFLCF